MTFPLSFLAHTSHSTLRCVRVLLCGVLLGIGSFFALTHPASAATKYWIGSAGGNFTDNANWSTSDGGANNTTAPGASDVATFTATINNAATINSSISVQGIAITTYTAAITQSNGASITIGSSGYSQVAGSLTMDDGDSMTVSGPFTISGGAFNANASSISLSGDVTAFTNAPTTAFLPGTSTVTLTGGAATLTNTSTSLSFYNLVVNATDGAAKSLGDGANIFVSNALTLTDGKLNYAGTLGQLRLTGSTFSQASTFDGGTGLISFEGGGTINLVSGNLPGIQTPNTTVNGPSSGTLSIGGRLNVQNSGVFTAGAGDITVEENLYAGNSGTFTTGSGVLTVKGILSMSSGATFTTTSSTIVLSGGDASISASSSDGYSFHNLTINSTGTKTFAETSVTGTLTLTDGNIGTGPIHLTGGLTHGAGFDGGTGTISIEGSGTRTINLTAGGEMPGVTLNAANVTMNGPSSGTTQFDETYTLQAGAFTGGGGGLLFQNDLHISGGAFTGGGGLVTANSDSTTDGFFLSGGTFTAGSGTQTFNDIHQTGGTYNGGSGITTLTYDFHLAGGTFNAGAGTYHIHTANVDSTTFNADTSAFYFDTDDTGTMDVGTITFHDLTINVADDFTFSSGDTITVTGTLHLTDGDLTGASATFHAHGDVIVNANWGGSDNTDLILDGSGAQDCELQVGDGNGVHNLTLDNASAVCTLTGGSSSDDGIHINGDVTLSAGTITTGTSLATLGVAGSWTQDGGTFAGGSGALTISGGLFLNGGTFSIPDALVATFGYTKTGGVLDMEGEDALIVFGGDFSPGGTDSDSDFTNVAFFGLDSTITILGNVNVTGSLYTILAGGSTSGTVNQGSYDVTVGDDFYLDSGMTYTGGSGTLTTSTFGQTGGTYTGGSGTIHVDSFLQSAGTFTAPSLLTIDTDFARSGGTFSGNSGTVSFTGSNETVSGSTTFANLTKSVSSADTLTLNAGDTFTVTGTTTLKGTSGHLLSLRSSTGGSVWNINPSGTRDIQYVDVKDSTNTNTSAILCTTGCVDSGNNTRWEFPSIGAVPTAPTLRSPANEALLNTVLPPFVFDRSTDEDNNITSYTLYLDAGTSSAKTVSFGNIHPIATHTTSKARIVTTNDRIYATLTDTSLLSEGDHTWFVRVTDTDDNTADSATRSFTVDTTPPSATSVLLDGSSSFRTSGTTPTLSAIVSDAYALRDAVLTVTDPSTRTTVFSHTTNLTGTTQRYAHTITTTLAPGDYTLRLVLSDTAGNTTTISKTLSILSPAEAQTPGEGNGIRTPSIEEVQEQYARGETPSRVPPEFTLPVLQQHEEERRIVQNANLNAFLSAFIPPSVSHAIDQALIAFHNGAEQVRTTLADAVSVLYPRTLVERIIAAVVEMRTNHLAFASNTTTNLADVLSPFTNALAWFQTGAHVAFEGMRGAYNDSLLITNVAVHPTSSGADITWITSHAARGKVNYGPSPTYGDEVSEDGFVSSHRATLTNIPPNTTIYFEILATDLRNQTTYDAYYRFTTSNGKLGFERVRFSSPQFTFHLPRFLEPIRRHPGASFSALAILTTLLSALATISLMPFETGNLFFRLLQTLIPFLAFRRRRLPIGRVVDEFGAPVQGAQVLIFDAQGKVRETLTTGPEGYVATLLPQGIYTLRAQKSGYAFLENPPALPLFPHETLYHGQQISVTTEDALLPFVLVLAAHREPRSTDAFVRVWKNTFAHLRLFFGELARPLLLLGAASILFALITDPSPFTIALTVLYAMHLLLEVLLSRRYSRVIGRVEDSTSKVPVALALLRLLDPQTGHILQTKVTTSSGHFLLLLPRGHDTLHVLHPKYRLFEKSVYTLPVVGSTVPSRVDLLHT